MCQCNTISERLCISPNERLQSYIKENNIVNGQTKSVEQEKEDDSIDEDDIGEDADANLGDDNNHDDIKDDRDGDNNDYHDIDFDSDDDDDKDEQSNSSEAVFIETRKFPPEMVAVPYDFLPPAVEKATMCNDPSEAPSKAITDRPINVDYSIAAADSIINVNDSLAMVPIAMF